MHQHEGDGIHEIGLPGAIGPDDAGELTERPDLHAALVGLEVLDDDLMDPSHGAAGHLRRNRALAGYGFEESVRTPGALNISRTC